MLFVYLLFFLIYDFFFLAVIKLGCFLPTVRWCAPSLTFRHVPALFSSSLVHFFFQWSLLKLNDTHIIKQNLILQNCKKDSIHLQTDGCPSQNQQGQRRNYFMNIYQQVSKIKPEYIFLNPFIKIIFLMYQKMMNCYLVISFILCYKMNMIEYNIAWEGGNENICRQQLTRKANSLDSLYF